MGLTGGVEFGVLQYFDGAGVMSARPNARSVANSTFRYAVVERARQNRNRDLECDNSLKRGIQRLYFFLQKYEPLCWTAEK